MTEAMTTEVSVLMIVTFALTVAGLCIGVAFGWVAATMSRRPAPYLTPHTPEAEAYRAGRGLPPGAPIPNRSYWRAVELGEFQSPAWIKTPSQMAQEAGAADAGSTRAAKP